MKSAYLFRDTHPLALFGTASDRYKGWVGQIYCKDYKITSRSKVLGKQKYKEEVVEVACVEEFFEHFDFVEIDYTFYRPLLDQEGKPTPCYHTLESYCSYLPKNGAVVLKVPQLITAHNTWVADKKTKKREWKPNPLSAKERAELFINQFYKPAVALVGDRIAGFLFEYEYQRKDSGATVTSNIAWHEKLFDELPEDPRYHIEERTDGLKAPEFFKFLRERNIGNVFSHWSFLPTLQKQLEQSGGFTNSSSALIRLLTPRGMRYEAAFAKYFPFNRLIDEYPDMYKGTVALIIEGIRAGIRVLTASNNRAGGNAPEITRRVIAEFRKTA